jgi:hypothetical protein
MPDWEREEEERLGNVFHKDAIPMRGKANAPVGWIPYEDSESSSDEEEVKKPRQKVVRRFFFFYLFCSVLFLCFFVSLFL